jgi:Pretoxin HINT domain
VGFCLAGASDSRDERTGETRPQRVTDLLQHMVTEGVIRLTLKRVPDPHQTLLLVSNAGTETLSVTATHPVRVAGRGWVPAGDLRPGDRVESRDGLLQVLAIGVDLRVQPVYNLSVENAETYFAGDLGAWVHNSRFTPDQSALLDLIREIMEKRGGKKGYLTPGEWATVKGWGDELGFAVCRGPERHPNRPHGKNWHGHIGPIDHIWIR